jgi:hypothetical protein
MIYGLGSNYEGSTEMMDRFIELGVACIGWSPEDSESLQQMFSHIQVGDIIYLKSYPPAHGLFIKAVGIVISSKMFNIPDLGVARKVKWLWCGRRDFNFIKMGHVRDKYDNMRGGTIYPEYGPAVQAMVLEKIQPISVIGGAE